MPVAHCMSRWAFTPPMKCAGLCRYRMAITAGGTQVTREAEGCCCPALPESASSALAAQQTRFQFRIRRRGPQPDGDQGAGEILALDHALLGSVDGDLHPRVG